MRLSIIVPTIGRPTLAATLDSIERAGVDVTDEVIVVSDHCKEAVLPIVQQHSPFCGVAHHDLPERADDLGGTPRNVGLKYATGDYVLFMDDDDVYCDDALWFIRPMIVRGAGAIHMFQMRHPLLGTIWTREEIPPPAPGTDPEWPLYGNVGTPMFAVPRTCCLPKWDGQRCQDYRWIREALNVAAGLIQWHRVVICQVAPHDPNRRW